MDTGSIPQAGASGVSPRYLRTLPIFKEIVSRDVREIFLEAPWFLIKTNVFLREHWLPLYFYSALSFLITTNNRDHSVEHIMSNDKSWQARK
jgi:hypothetical protein